MTDIILDGDNMPEELTKLLEIKNDDMWFEGAPVLLRSMCLELDKQKGEMYTRVKFVNLKPAVIEEITFDVVCFDEYRKAIGKIEKVSFSGLEAERNDSFGYERKIPVPDIETRNMEYVLRSVSFSGGEKWENKEYRHFDRKIEQENIYSVQGDYNKQFMDICVRSGINGTDLVLQPIFEKDYWLCACGAFNWSEDKKCSQCKVNREWLERNTSLEYLRQNKEFQDMEKEKVKRQIEADEKRRLEDIEAQKAEFAKRNNEYTVMRKKKRSKDIRIRIWITIAVLLAVAGILYVVMTFVVPKFGQADEYDKKDDNEVVDYIAAPAQETFDEVFLY